MSAEFDDIVARIRALAMDEFRTSNLHTYPTPAQIEEANARVLHRLWNAIVIFRMVSPDAADAFAATWAQDSHGVGDYAGKTFIWGIDWGKDCVPDFRPEGHVRIDLPQGGAYTARERFAEGFRAAQSAGEREPYRFKGDGAKGLDVIVTLGPEAAADLANGATLSTPSIDVEKAKRDGAVHVALAALNKPGRANE